MVQKGPGRIIKTEFCFQLNIFTDYEHLHNPKFRAELEVRVWKIAVKVNKYTKALQEYFSVSESFSNCISDARTLDPFLRFTGASKHL